MTDEPTAPRAGMIDHSTASGQTEDGRTFIKGKRSIEQVDRTALEVG